MGGFEGFSTPRHPDRKSTSMMLGCERTFCHCQNYQCVRRNIEKLDVGFVEWHSNASIACAVPICAFLIDSEEELQTTPGDVKPSSPFCTEART